MVLVSGYADQRRHCKRRRAGCKMVVTVLAAWSKAGEEEGEEGKSRGGWSATVGGNRGTTGRLRGNVGGLVHNKIPTASYQNSLSYHGSAINALRFSPSREQHASSADGGELIIWKLHTTETDQSWKVFKSLPFHRKDVLDLQWSTDGAFLISGSVDNTCIIWDVNKGSVHQMLEGHFHCVQGVSWDPSSKYVASLNSDRTCRIYVNKPQTKTKGVEKLNYICQHTIVKTEQQRIDSKSIKSRLFHEETLSSFSRRLAWSPGGSFLLVPTVHFCPLAFNLRESNPTGFFKLSHHLVFAIATLNSLYIYDTESAPPISILASLHYAAITNIAWSYDARYLVLSSQDGYCTSVEFEKDELGVAISLSEPKFMNAENKSPIVQKPDEMVIETTRADDSITGDNTKVECAGRRKCMQRKLNA
ncbi:hypothetical protein REPUB_Repub01dG0101900 [Reevesia pubescens]